MTTTIDKSQAQTGTSNQHFDLISVLYHSLEGGATYEQYIQDAQQAGDNELARYFQDVKDTYCQLAQRGKDLLKQRLSQ